MSSIDPLQYRSVLGHFATGVTVVTGLLDGEPIGFTIGSFTSVSLDPPLVGFLPMTSSDRWHQIRQTGAFCVNVLGCNDDELCWRFSKTTVEHPFDEVGWTPAPVTGSPVMGNAIAWIDCTIAQVVDAGDHHFVIGAVEALEHADPESDPQPLVFFRGKLGQFAPH